MREGPDACEFSHAQAAAAWLFNLDRLQSGLLALEAREPRLSEPERLRADAIADGGRRTAWIAARVGLRLALESFAGCSFAGVAFEIAAAGRPFLPGPAPSFSLSHAGRYVLAVVASNGPVGADIEEIRLRRMAAVRQAQIEEFALYIAGGVALPEEGRLEQSGSRFIQAWCRLEAFAKADGRGVARVLSAAGIIGPGSGARRLSRTGLRHEHLPAFRAWDLAVNQLAPGYAAAVAGVPEAGLSELELRDGGKLLSLR